MLAEKTLKKILSYITSASGSELFKSELDATESISDGLLFSFTLALRKAPISRLFTTPLGSLPLSLLDIALGHRVGKIKKCVTSITK